MADPIIDLEAIDADRRRIRDPDGARLELIADPLGEMYGTVVG